jgi:hypothetical protein
VRSAVSALAFRIIEKAPGRDSWTVDANDAAS